VGDKSLKKNNFYGVGIGSDGVTSGTPGTGAGAGIGAGAGTDGALEPNGSLTPPLCLTNQKVTRARTTKTTTTIANVCCFLPIFQK